MGSSIKVSSKLTADITASYITYKKHNTPPVGGDNSYLTGLFYAAPRDYNPDVDLANQYRPDGSRRDVNARNNFPADAPAYPFNANNYMQNMFWSIYQNNADLNRNNLLGSIRLMANLTPWFTITGQGSIDNSDDKMEVKNYPTDAQGVENGFYSVRMDRKRTSDLLVLGRLYKDNLGGKEFNISLTAGAEQYAVNNYASGAATRGGFLNPFLFNAKNGRDVPSRDDMLDLPYRLKTNSLISIVDVSYKNYLFLQATGRKDWVSTLNRPYNTFNYPSASLSYVFSDGIKGFKEAIPWLSFGKLSLSYAQTGNGAEAYATNVNINSERYNGVPAQTLADVLTNPNIKPQKTKQYEAILSLGLFNNRLNIELTGYTGNSSPQIVTNPLPMSSGVQTIRINDAKISNKGLEFIINATPVSNERFSWNIAVNGSRSTNKLLYLSGSDSVLTIGNIYGDQGVYQKVKVGDNFGTIYGKNYTCYANGKPIVKPAPYHFTTSDGQVHTAGTQWVLTDGVVPIGNSLPKLTGGVANTFRYKNLSFFVLTDFKLGGDTWFGSYSGAMGNGLRKETLKERNGGGVDYTYPDGSTSKTGIIKDGVFADGTPNNISEPASWYYATTFSTWNHVGIPASAAVFKNSWMKLREVNITYQLPKTIVTKTKMFQNLSLSLIGRDLFYIFTTIPKGLNPEGVNGIGNAQGLESSSLPNFRSFGFSVRASF